MLLQVSFEATRVAEVIKPPHAAEIWNAVNTRYGDFLPTSAGGNPPWMESICHRDPTAPLSRISADELESEMRRRWAKAPATCESAHIYRHALTGPETCEKLPRRRSSELLRRAVSASVTDLFPQNSISAHLCPFLQLSLPSDFISEPRTAPVHAAAPSRQGPSRAGPACQLN